MTNSLLHIGLHVLEEDVQKFYLDILNCEPKNNFTIQAEDAFLIFGISREVRVQLVSSGGIELELFIDDIKKTFTFGHICFRSTDAERIIVNASEKGYHTFIRKRNSNETYFISDSNQNLFEIKKI